MWRKSYKKPNVLRVGGIPKTPGIDRHVYNLLYVVQPYISKVTRVRLAENPRNIPQADKDTLCYIELENSEDLGILALLLDKF